MPVVSTQALVFYLLDLVEGSRLETKANFATNHLRKMCLVVLERIHRDCGAFAYLTDSRKIEISSAGIVNLKRFMTDDEEVHGNVFGAFHKLWGEMRVSGLITTAFDAASFVDVTVFLSKCVKFKRNKRSPMSAAGIAFRNLMRGAWIKFLASSLDVVVMMVHSNGALEERQVPSRGRKERRNNDDDDDENVDNDNETGEPQQKVRKHHVKVSLDTMWDWYEHANNIGMSLPAYVQTKEREHHGGCHDQTCQLWIRKIHMMYTYRSCLSFKTAKSINIIADASRFHGRETLISVAYNAEDDVAVYLPNQLLHGGQQRAPDELLLESNLEAMVAQRKIERHAAYSQLEAINNQLKHVSQGNLTTRSFDFEGTNIGAAVKPLGPNKLRIVTKDGNDRITGVHIRDKQTGESKPIVLNGSEIDDIHTLLLGLDQGTAGTALASFLTGTKVDSSHLVAFLWDPYHRCARDMKLAMNMASVVPIKRKDAKSCLQKAHLASTYLWSVNYKPFNSSAFLQQKQEILENFIGLQDEETLSKNVYFNFRP